MARGRSRHPDTLTPRELAVLELVRREKTNEQIADELGMTLDGAKYHVSSILSKLGVTSRLQAAAWTPEAAPGKRTAILWVLAFVGGGATVAATAGLALLAWGIWLSSDDDIAATVQTPGLVSDFALAGEDGRLVLSIGRTQKTVNVPCDVAIYWAPDGKHLACASQGGGRLVSTTILDSAGKVMSQFDSDATSFSWAPGSDSYVYTGSAGSETDLFWGTSSVALASNPVWLPDGRLAAYRPVEASLGPDRTAGIDIYTGNEAHFIPLGNYRPLAAVLNGRALLVAGNYVGVSDQTGPTFEAAVLDIETQRLAPVPALNNQLTEWISPDGHYGVSLSSNNGSRELSIVDFQTLEVSPIAGSTITYPSEFIPRQNIALSPDNSAVYWVDVSGPADLYRASLPDGNPERLTSVPGGLVAFSPDFNRIAYIAPGNPPQLVTSRLDGSDARSLGPVRNAFAWRPLSSVAPASSLP